MATNNRVVENPRKEIQEALVELFGSHVSPLEQQLARAKETREILMAEQEELIARVKSNPQIRVATAITHSGERIAIPTTRRDWRYQSACGYGYVKDPTVRVQIGSGFVSVEYKHLWVYKYASEIFHGLGLGPSQGLGSYQKVLWPCYEAISDLSDAGIVELAEDNGAYGLWEVQSPRSAAYLRISLHNVRSDLWHIDQRIEFLEERIQLEAALVRRRMRPTKVAGYKPLAHDQFPGGGSVDINVHRTTTTHPGMVIDRPLYAEEVWDGSVWFHGLLKECGATNHDLLRGVLPATYKQVRKQWMMEDGILLPASPSIGNLLGAMGAPKHVITLFNQRGPLPKEDNLVFISNEIEPLLSITEWAKGWESCQKWDRRGTCGVFHLPTDPDVHVVWAGSETCMAARMLIRIGFNEQYQQRVVLHRYYGETSFEAAMRAAVLSRFDLPFASKGEVIRGSKIPEAAFVKAAGYSLDRPYLDEGTWKTVGSNTQFWIQV